MAWHQVMQPGVIDLEVNHNGNAGDDLRKAKAVFEAAKWRNLVVMQGLHDNDLINGYTEYSDFGDGTALLVCMYDYGNVRHTPHTDDIFIQIITILLENGANPLAVITLHSRMGALHMAAEYTNTELFRLILFYGRDNRDFVNQRDCRDRTPLHTAATELSPTRDNIAIVRILIKEGADVNAVDSGGKTPLFKAVHVCRPNLPAAKALCENGADVCIQNKHGQTPLHLAVSNAPIALLLIEHDADVNAVDSQGDTPLFNAVRYYNLTSAMALWHRGANVHILNLNGRSPTSLCANANPVKSMLEAEMRERRNEAFAMGHHARLGNREGSMVQHLGEDGIKMVLEAMQL